MANAKDLQLAPSPPWWKVPMVWLIISGPLIVVIASFVTLGLAVKYPDQVLSTQSANSESGSGGVNKPPSPANLPAMQARNHAATGGQ